MTATSTLAAVKTPHVGMKTLSSESELAQGKPCLETLYYIPWRSHIEGHRKRLGFEGAKRLAHRLFDFAVSPRPYVKCHFHSGLLGYATAEWEMFVAYETTDDTVIHEASHLLTWPYSDKDDPLEGHSMEWASTYVALLREFSSVPSDCVDSFASAVGSAFGKGLASNFGTMMQAAPRGTMAHWANLRPGHASYDLAVQAGCRAFASMRREPSPPRA